MGAFQIVVQTISGFPMEVDVYATDTIATLKASIFYTTLVPSQSQILVYCCTQLENGKALSDYGIVHGSTLHLRVLNAWATCCQWSVPLTEVKRPLSRMVVSGYVV